MPEPYPRPEDRPPFARPPSERTTVERIPFNKPAFHRPSLENPPFEMSPEKRKLDQGASQWEHLRNKLQGATPSQPSQPIRRGFEATKPKEQIASLYDIGISRLRTKIKECEDVISQCDFSLKSKQGTGFSTAENSRVRHEAVTALNEAILSLKEMERKKEVEQRDLQIMNRNK